MLNKIIIPKYGTNTLTTETIDGGKAIDHNNMAEHGKLINALTDPSLIVSSGAVGYGKALADFSWIEDPVLRKRIQAMKGNPHLAIAWDKFIKDKEVLQGLATHRAFANGTKQEVSRVLKAIYSDPLKCVAVLNDNDFLSDEELKNLRGGDFGDNDKEAILAAEVCLDFAERVEVIIQTSTNGVLDSTGRTIDQLKVSDLSDEVIRELCGETTSEDGTGGMAGKLTHGRELMKQFGDRVSLVIINGKNPQQFKNLLAGKSVGTQLLAA